MKKLIFAVPLALTLCACGGHQEENKLRSIEPDRFTVATETVRPRDISQDLLLTGSVKAWEEAVIFPRVDGKLFKNILKEGDAVKKNENIALIDRDEVGAVYQPVVVPSTLTGIIGRIFLDPGANVTKTTPIALVVNQETVRILIEIPERYIGKIHIGQKAAFTIDAYNGRDFEGEIYKMSPVVDTQTRSVSAELKADNKDGAIKSGMFARVQLILDESKNAPSVSLSSVLEEEQKFYLFKVEGETVRKTEFQPGLRSSQYQEIVSGAANGDEVAKIIFGLKDGSKIKIEN